MAIHDQAYKLAAARLKARQAQNQQNAPYFAKYYAAHPELVAPVGTPGVPTRPTPSPAEQNQMNAPYFQAYFAAHPELTPPPGTPGIQPQQPQAPANSPNGDISSPDFRDSTFGVGLSSLLGQIQRQRQAIADQGQLDQQGFNENLGRIANQRTSSLNDTRSGANRQGLFYSTVLGQRQGQVNATYDDQVNQQQQALTGRNASRAAQLQQIGELTADPNSPYGYSATGDAGLSFYNLLREAADRRVSQTATDPVAEPQPTTMAPPPAASSSGPAAPTGAGTPTASLPVYHPGTAANPAPATKPRAPIHGTGKLKTLTLKRKKK